MPEQTTMVTKVREGKPSAFSVIDLNFAMKEIAEWALNIAALRGASYADARIVDERSRALATKNGKIGSASDAESQGIGIRVIADGAWGFAASDNLSREAVESTAAQAVAIAKASASVKQRDVQLAPEKPATAEWTSPYKTDPFTTSVEQELKLVENARRVGEEAVALLKAEQCPHGVSTIILDGSQLGLQIHESVGHPIELDRVLGMEANFAGTSFLTLDKLRNLGYGSDLVNIVADARQDHGPGLGTFAFDDEGVPAQCTPIITNGLFTGYLSSRETAHTIGANRSAGTLRAEGWNPLPIIRMTNITILPGLRPLRREQLIADTESGIYMETNRSWSIDDKRYNFQFGCEAGWEIKNGKRTRMLKSPSYSGITTEFWNSLDAICSRDEWVLWGTPHCGKGQPQQVMGTGHGAAPARFRNVKVGSAYKGN